MMIIDHEGEGMKAITGGDVSLQQFFPEPVTRTRASRIEPVSLVKRLCFRALRRLGGDRGRIAAWTRRWQGPWRATLLSTGATFTHPQRSECIRWEIQQLTNHSYASP
jgi:hypothetical protein